MVTKDELSKFFNVKSTSTKTSYQVTAAELSHFIDNNNDLSELISDRKKQYERENNISATDAYLDIEEKCHISIDTFKKAMCGQRKITRKFLYKFTVGMQMSIDEANEYFELCGGPLSTKSIEDYICIKAIRDKDTVEQLIKDFKKHVSLNI